MKEERSILPRKDASCLSLRSSCIRVRIPRLTHNTVTIPYPTRNSPVKIARDLSCCLSKNCTRGRMEYEYERMYSTKELKACVTVENSAECLDSSLPRQPRPPYLRLLLCPSPSSRLGSLPNVTVRHARRVAYGEKVEKTKKKT